MISLIYGAFGVCSMSMRVELNLLGFYNVTVNSIDCYNRIITAHGIGMIFLFIMPVLLGFAGNWLLPQGYGALDFSVPRLNQASVWSLIAASMILICSLSREEGVSAGWTLYPPLTDSSYHSSSAMSLVILAVHILGLSSEGGSITFLVSLLCSRATGLLTLLACLFSWSILTASVLLILTLPVLGAGVTLLLLDRIANSAFLSPAMSGDPLTFQHLFWYFGHPEVYVIILPAFGLVSLVLAASVRSSVSGHLGMILAILSIAAVGFFVWAHHMFVAGISDDSRLYFSAATMVIAIPTAVKIFTWVSTLCSAAQLTTDLLVVHVFLLCFSCGGFTGLVLSNAVMDILLHDTYYVVGHFHYVLSIAASLAAVLVVRLFLGQSLRADPSAAIGRLALLTLTASTNWLFLAQHSVGLDGHPRRIFSSSEALHIATEIANLSIPAMVIGIPLFWSSLVSRSATPTKVGLVIYSELYIISTWSSSLFLDRRTSVHEF